MRSKKIADGSRIHFVDDGSSDGTWSIIASLCESDKRIRGIKLSRNRGHQNALLAGMFTAEGDAIVTVDADFQDDPSVIEQMVDRLRDGLDLVYGVRRSRAQDTAFKRWSARFFYTAMRAMGVDLIHDHADFRLMSGKAVKALSTFGEVNLFLRGIMPLVGFRSAMVYYDRTERLAGTSKYLLWKMVAFAAEGVTSFSIVPLRFITATGLVVFLVTGAISCWVLWIRLFTTTAVPGWPSTVLPLYFLGGIQIFSLGVIGEYLGKVYQEVKKRPRYIIETII